MMRLTSTEALMKTGSSDFVVSFISSDSLGLRSMATLIKTDVSFIIDPSASLAPKRYGLPPHKKELELLEEKLKEIKELEKRVDFAIITHYHYDHYIKDHIYSIPLYVKHPEKEINNSQKTRAKRFLKNQKEWHPIDGEELKIKRTKIVFSKPFWHGEKNTKLGKVISIKIKYKKDVFYFSSDISGPMEDDFVEFVDETGICYIDGFPLVFLRKYRHKLEKTKENLKKLEEKGCKIILDHHSPRIKEFKKYFEHKTVAEVLNKRPLLLEAFRKELWNGQVF